MKSLKCLLAASRVADPDPIGVLLFLILQKNSAQRAIKIKIDKTWKERPATMRCTPPFLVEALKLDWSAMPPPADCSTKAIKSENMNVMV
jgi:hypothetical protein